MAVAEEADLMMPGSNHNPCGDLAGARTALA